MSHFSFIQADFSQLFESAAKSEKLTLKSPDALSFEFYCDNAEVFNFWVLKLLKSPYVLSKRCI